MQAGGLLGGPGPDLLGIDQGWPAIGQDHPAIDLHGPRSDVGGEGQPPGVHIGVRPGHPVGQRLGKQVPAGGQPSPGHLGRSRHVVFALARVSHAELVEHVGPDPVAAQGHRVGEPDGSGVADGVVHVGSGVVDDGPGQAVVVQQVYPMDQEPVVGSQVS